MDRRDGREPWQAWIAASCWALTGIDLGADPYLTDRAVLCHRLGDDPLFVYANEFAQRLWERPWHTMIGLPSRLTAPPDHRSSRSGALSGNDVVTGYSGERISATGRRFVIHDATVWPVRDDDARLVGQAATFQHFERLELPLLEVLATSADEVAEAVRCGADRIELCVDYPAGGVTPPPELISAAVAATRESSVGVMVMIRPRPGDFVYSPSDIDVMRSAVDTAVTMGAAGVVAGCLTPGGGVDETATRRLVEAAQGVPVTFHRAVDDAADPVAAALTAFELGCARVLTSGGAPTAVEGVESIRRMVEAAPRDAIVMPGSGVRSGNAQELRTATGATELHASLKFFR